MRESSFVDTRFLVGIYIKEVFTINRYIYMYVCMYCDPDELDVENPTRKDKLVKIRPSV